jgi:hypothetical protein
LDSDYLRLKFVSVYWFYFSCFFYYELPLEPFLNLNEARVKETERIRVLLLSSIQKVWPTEIYEGYRTRWEEI